jgi:hypothetical protein
LKASARHAGATGNFKTLPSVILPTDQVHSYS